MERDADVHTDLESLERLRSGDDSVFDTIVLRFHPELHAYITRWLGGDAEASDVLQQMFLRLWETRFVVEMPYGMRAYLYAAARGFAQRYIRDTHRAHVREARYAQEYAESIPPHVDSAVDQNELIEAVRAAVEQLPEGAREVWRLCREQELTYQETAAILGISVNTVKTQLARSLRTIRNTILPLLSLPLFYQQ